MNEKVRDPVFRNFIKRVIERHEHDYDIQYKRLPIPHSDASVKDATVELFARALFFQSSVSFVTWQPFLKNYAQEITRNPRDYLNTVLHLCRRVRQGTVVRNREGKPANLFGKFVSIVATACGAARFYWNVFGKSYFKYTVPVLIVYFELEFRDAFYYDPNVWDNLFMFLCAQMYIGWSDEDRRRSRNYSYLSAVLETVSASPHYSDAKYLVPQVVLTDKRSLYLCDVMIEFFVMSILVDKAEKFWDEKEIDYWKVVVDEIEFKDQELLGDESIDSDDDDDLVEEPCSEEYPGMSLVTAARLNLHYAGASIEVGKRCCTTLVSTN